MHTSEFRRHFVWFVHVQMLMNLRLATKGWKAAANALIDEGVRSGQLMVYDGKDIRGGASAVEAREERMKLVTRVVFLLNITKVGRNACEAAIKIVVVDIPEGVEKIGDMAFSNCKSLIAVSFLTTLKYIGRYSFVECFSLDNVDLLHTNLQELGREVFWGCYELKSMTVPN